MTRPTGKSRTTPRNGAIRAQLAETPEGWYFRVLATPPDGGPERPVGEPQGPYPTEDAARQVFLPMFEKATAQHGGRIEKAAR